MAIRFELTSIVIIVAAVWQAIVSVAYAAKPLVGPNVVVVDVTVPDDIALQKLKLLDDESAGMEIWSDIPRPGVVSVRADLEAIALIDHAGFSYRVTIRDLQAHINHTFGEEGEGDFFDSLRSYDEHVDFIQQLAAAHPEVTEVFSIGQSVQGRDIWCLRIGANRGAVPGVVYHGAQHGDEAAGGAVVAYIAQYLLSNYQSDEYVAGLVNDVDWFLITITNPDGYQSHSRYNANGIDLNRNWGGPGGALNPFSQPETAAMRDLFLANSNIRGHIDFHGYVRWLMWPWGHSDDYTPEHELFQSVVHEVGSRILAAGGGEYEQGTIWDVAYPVSGGSIDYTYGELGVWGFVFEVADPLMPAICEEFLEGSLFVAEMIRDCLDSGTAPNPAEDCNFNGIVDSCDVSLSLFADGNENGVLDVCDPFTHSVPADGAVVVYQPHVLTSNSYYYPQPSIRLFFPSTPTELQPFDFTVSVDPPGLVPVITNIYVQNDSVYLAFGTGGPVPPRGMRKWTTVVHNFSGASTRVGYLPGDVNGDGYSGPSDVLALIDAINGVTPQPAASTDIDRSNATNGNDVVRLIDLLNGAEAFVVWNGASLP